MPHISYFINTYTFKGFLKSLISLPGHNARGLTSKNLRPVPWGNQYKIDGIYSLYDREAYDEDAEYEEEDYDNEYEYKEQIIEHLSPQGWVRI